LPIWQAGDIAEIGPQQAVGEVDSWLARHHLDGDANVIVDGKNESLSNLAARSSLDVAVEGTDPQRVAERLVRLPHRDYSIATIPADGGIELLLRQWRRDDGSLGVGTGWLTEYADPGAEISVRIRTNTGFHVPIDARPILLIGNGTGMASLRALLRQRVAQKHHRNWLIFGERNADRDFHYGRDILAWKAGGQIERLDLAFSRDQGERVHVQDLLERAAESVREWVEQGAVIYVCGSLEGMAPGVDAALRRILGDVQLQRLASSARYRRDVY
jgi:sulfite reductase (NADPH) flavoprotein alpha-component